MASQDEQDSNACPSGESEQKLNEKEIPLKCKTKAQCKCHEQRITQVEKKQSNEAKRLPPKKVPKKRRIQDYRTGDIIEADVIDATIEIVFEKMNRDVWWSEDVIDREQAEQKDDQQWNWLYWVIEAMKDEHLYCKLLQTPDNDIQSAIVYEIEKESFLEPGKKSVYIERVASAPRNRKVAIDGKKYKGTGQALITVAVIRSFLLGYEGRVTLSALPYSGLEQFYRFLGFKDLEEEDEDGLPKYELTPDKALELVGVTNKKSKPVKKQSGSEE